jgi:hypothetical protein
MPQSLPILICVKLPGWKYAPTWPGALKLSKAVEQKGGDPKLTAAVIRLGGLVYRVAVRFRASTST